MLREWHSCLCRYKKDALLYQYIPSILFAWHLIYEVCNTRMICQLYVPYRYVCCTGTL